MRNPLAIILLTHCILAPDNHSRLAIQMIMYELPFDDEFVLAYGHPSEGKIGQYQLGDSSNGFHPSSGEANQWVIDKSVEINNYFIKQSRYPFSPRYHTDMSRRPEAPETDLAIVGAKISEVGTPGYQVALPTMTATVMIFSHPEPKGLPGMCKIMAPAAGPLAVQLRSAI